MKAFHLIVSTPSGKAFDGDALSLTVKGTEGEVGILADHIPFVTTVISCQSRIKLTDSDIITADISDGLLTVSKEVTTLLVNYFNRK